MVSDGHCCVEEFARNVDGYKDSNVDMLVIAGEHSGDSHIAKIISSIKRDNSNFKVCAIGGEKLKNAGADLIFDLTKFSVVGFFEVLKHYVVFKKILKLTARFIEVSRPKAVCLVDFPGFNLRLAKLLFDRGISNKSGGNVKLYYYISPQIWAWKSGRRFLLEKYIDSLGVIFPFELDCFSDTKQLDVKFVGHPFSDSKMPFYYDECGPLLLLAGSRLSAVKRMLPIFLTATALLIKNGIFRSAVILFPDDKIKQAIERILCANEFAGIKDSVQLLHHGESFEPIGVSSAIMSSGTASFMAGLAGIPGVISYRANIFTYFLAKLLVKVKFLSISNILMNAEIYPEILDHKGNQASIIYDKIVNQMNNKATTRIFFNKASLELNEKLKSPEKLKTPESWLTE